MREQAGSVLALVHHAAGPVRGDEALAAPAGQRFLHVHLALEAGRHVLVEVRALALADGPQLRAAALRAGPLLLGDSVFDDALRERDLRFAACTPRRLRHRRVCGLLVPELLGDRRHLLAALPEDVALERSELTLELLLSVLDLSELRCEPFGFVPPRTLVVFGAWCQRAVEIIPPPSLETGCGGTHCLGRRTRLRSMPSSSMASWLLCSRAPSAPSRKAGSRKRPCSRRL